MTDTTDFDREQPAVNRKKLVGKIADLIDSSGIDPDDIASINRVNLLQGMSKDDNGEPVVTDLVGIQLSPAWSEGPQWPVVQPAAPVTIKYRKPLASKAPEVRTTILLPDPQVGYLRFTDGQLEPMHDERAMDVSLQVVGDVRPQRIVNLGDFLDLSEFTSKFTVDPEFSLTTQPALDRGHRYLAEQKAAADEDTDVALLGGNHDDRLGISVARNAMAALRLRPGGSPPDSWPALSIPHLLGLDDLGVTYVGAYPAGRIKIAGEHGEQTPLYALHGKRTDMAKQAKSERHSTVQGHAHHFSVHSETYDHDRRPQQVQSWSLGCLCRTDGAVPSTNGGYDDTGRPALNIESWQQMVAVVTETDSGWWLEPVMIHDGTAFYRGKEFRSRVDLHGEAL